MALPVANDLDGSMARLLRLLAPQPGRLEFAARLALICALTVLVVEIYQTPSAALTAYMAFFLNKPDRVTSIILSAAMVLVMTLLIGLLFLLANVVLEQPAWRVAAMATISFVCLFLVSASKLRPVGQTFAIVIAFALDLLGSVPVGELATRGLLYAWLYIGIPAGISIIVSLLLAPSPRQLLQRDLAGRMRLAADLLRSPDREARGALSHCLHGEVVEIASLLRLAGAEKTSLPSDLAALGEAAHASIAVLLAVEFVLVTPGAALPDHTRASLARTLDEMAAILKDGGYPSQRHLGFLAGRGPFAARRRRLRRNPRCPGAICRDARGRTRKAAQAEDRFPPARRIHEHDAYSLRAEDHGSCHVLLPALFDTGLARHPYLPHHLLYRFPGHGGGECRKAHPSYCWLPDWRRPRAWHHDFSGSILHINHRPAGHGVYRCSRGCMGRCGQPPHCLCRLSDRLRLFPLRCSRRITRL